MNRKKSVVLLSLFVSALLLSGCAGLRDLATEPNALPAKEQSIARRIAEKATSTCGIVSYKRHDTPPSGGGAKLREAPVVVKLFSSTNSSFYKADIVIYGVWGSVFFDSKNERIVCGEKSWQAIKGAEQVIFREVSPQPIKEEAKATLSQATSAANARPTALPSSNETRHEKPEIKESTRPNENIPAPPQVNPSPSPSPKPSVTPKELVEPAPKTSQRSSVTDEARGKCVIKQAMTDEEIARCK